MSSLASREKKFLLEVARRALALAAERGESLEDLPTDEKFSRPGGAFVTLKRRRTLRGCIGQLASDVPLIRVIAHCAKAAALEDPRFEPVRPEEVAEIDIELSVLSDPEDISPEQIECGRHGLMISRGSQRGLLLPQVAAEFHWTSQRFIEETCIKGGFDRNAWKDGATRIQAFTAEVFSEATLRAEVEGEPESRA